MSTIRRSRSVVLGIAAVLAVALAAPVAAQTEEQPLAAAPAAPSWDETSGYDAVESSRAAYALPAAPAAITNQVPGDVRWAPAATAADAAWDATSGYGAVEASRAAIAPNTLTSGEASGPTGHEVSAAIGVSWDETTGYSSAVEGEGADQMFGPR